MVSKASICVLLTLFFVVTGLAIIMERRGKIPIATFRTADGKLRSRSRARELNRNDSDPEMDMFTLLEENSTLKEENKSLNIKIADFMENVKGLEEDNLQLRIQIKNLNDKKSEKFIEISNTPEIIKEPVLSVFTSSMKRCENYSSITSKHTKEEFIKMLANTCSNEFESLVDFHEQKSDLVPFKCIQSLLQEFSQLKANYNNIELQLYEANEKISELLEQQTLLEEENKSLRMKNNWENKEQFLLNQNNVHVQEPVIMMKEESNSECDILKPDLENLESDNTCGERIVEVVLTL